MTVIYAKSIDRIRIAIAVVIAICGLGYVLCVRYVSERSGANGFYNGSTSIKWLENIFGFGLLSCFLAFVLLYLEYLSRPADASVNFRWSFLKRLVGVIAVLSIVFALTYLLCGVKQSAGALIGGSLLMAAWRETVRKRIILAVAGVSILGMTYLTTLSADYFVQHNAEEIVNAGTIFREGCSPVQAGVEIALHDPRIPAVFHKMGAQRIWIDPDRIAVYVDGDREFQIYRDPHPGQTDNPVWGFRGKGATKINDRLWSNDY